MTVAGVVRPVGGGGRGMGRAESMEIVLTKSGNRSFCFGPLFPQRERGRDLLLVGLAWLRRPSAALSAIRRHFKSFR